MIIEWIGCSGAGKSTLCRGVYNLLLSSGIDTIRPLEIFLGRTLGQTVHNETLRNIFLDLLVFPWALASIIKYKVFIKNCLQILNRDHSSLIKKLILLRSILRKTGLHIFLNSYCNTQKMILVDEGTVHIAHLLFSNGNKLSVSEKEVAKFCKHAPTPDLIVHIMAPESETIKRTNTRKHKPIANTTPEAIIRFIHLGQEIFYIFKKINPWKQKTITILNHGNPIRNDKENIANITNQIMNSLRILKEQSPTK